MEGDNPECFVKILNMTLVIGGAAALVAASAPMPSPAHAQDTEVGSHRDWTLQQREDWLTDRVVSSRDNGALEANATLPW